MNTFTLGACFQHELHTGPYCMTFAPRLIYIYIYIYRESASRFSRRTVLNTLKQSGINIKKKTKNKKNP